jgi:glutaredoxin-like protein NrdH
MKTTRVDGNQAGRLTLFTLSTCVWCKRTKSFLNDLGVGYEFIDLDLLEGQEKESALDEVKKFNPRCSFPSLVVDGSTCIVGFDEQKIREALIP